MGSGVSYLIGGDTMLSRELRYEFESNANILTDEELFEFGRKVGNLILQKCNKYFKPQFEDYYPLDEDDIEDAVKDALDDTPHKQITIESYDPETAFAKKYRRAL